MIDNRSIIYLLFSTDTSPTKSYTLSLHDALPIYEHQVGIQTDKDLTDLCVLRVSRENGLSWHGRPTKVHFHERHEEHKDPRSEEHTSELQSPYELVCRLLLEKKKNKRQNI